MPSPLRSARNAKAARNSGFFPMGALYLSRHGIRAIKDAMSRDILDQFDAAKIGIASGTYEAVGFPEVEFRALADEKAVSRGAEVKTEGRRATIVTRSLT